jgi:hypothetical protein
MTHAESSPPSKAFDLAYQNLQSISRAQRFYLSALLVYLCAVWGWYFVGGGDSVTIQVLGITLKAGGLWVITPAVTTLLTLALIGSVNAAGPSWQRLRESIAHEPTLSHLRSGLVFYEVDTNKNIFDYFSFLRIHPEQPPNQDPRRRFETRHFLYPLLYAASIWTTWTAISKTYVLADSSRELLHPNIFLAIGLACILFQGIFAVRPWYRAACRFVGVRTNHVYED